MRYLAAPSGLEPRIDPPRLCARLAWLGVAFGGLTSKIHAVVDTSGLPVWLALTAGLWATFSLFLRALLVNF